MCFLKRFNEDIDTPVVHMKNEDQQQSEDPDTVALNVTQIREEAASVIDFFEDGPTSPCFSEEFPEFEIYTPKPQAFSGSEHTGSLASWGDDDFDKKATKRVADLFDEIDAVLYENVTCSNPQLQAELEDWRNRFPHLRVVGKSILTKDQGINKHNRISSSARLNSGKHIAPARARKTSFTQESLSIIGTRLCATSPWSDAHSSIEDVETEEIFAEDWSDFPDTQNRSLFSPDADQVLDEYHSPWESQFIDSEELFNDLWPKAMDELEPLVRLQVEHLSRQNCIAEKPDSNGADCVEKRGSDIEEEADEIVLTDLKKVMPPSPRKPRRRTVSVASYHVTSRPPMFVPPRRGAFTPQPGNNRIPVAFVAPFMRKESSDPEIKEDENIESASAMDNKSSTNSKLNAESTYKSPTKLTSINSTATKKNQTAKRVKLPPIRKSLSSIPNIPNYRTYKRASSGDILSANQRIVTRKSASWSRAQTAETFQRYKDVYVTSAFASRARKSILLTSNSAEQPEPATDVELLAQGIEGLKIGHRRTRQVTRNDSIVAQKKSTPKLVSLSAVANSRTTNVAATQNQSSNNQQQPSAKTKGGSNSSSGLRKPTISTQAKTVTSIKQLNLSPLRRRAPPPFRV